MSLSSAVILGLALGALALALALCVAHRRRPRHRHPRRVFLPVPYRLSLGGGAQHPDVTRNENGSVTGK